MGTQDTSESGDGIPENVGGLQNFRGLTRAQSRAVDRYAIEVLGIPGVVLMENAGINAAGAVVDVLKKQFIVDEGSARVAILCGGGNNGGDGYVVARQLLSWGLSPRVYGVKPVEGLSGDAAVNAAAWVGLGQNITRIDDPAGLATSAERWRGDHVVVDALLGTGFGAEHGAMRGPTAAVVAAVNGLTAPAPGTALGSGEADFRGRGRVVALDVPSGLDADTGRAVGEAIKADLTVTFVAEKAGFAKPGAGVYLGKVVAADIGLPASAVAAALRAEAESATRPPEA